MTFKLAALLGTLCLSACATAPLVSYVSYLGGWYDDTAAGIAVDSNGSAYVAGTTDSPDFPLTSTVLGTPSTRGNCAFVTKFNPSGTAIDFSVCVAGSSATAFALDPSGNLYVAIQKISNSTPTSYAVVKLDPTGQTILYTTLIGAAGESIAADAAGNVYVAGAAGPGLATTPGAYQRNSAGTDQCHVINGTYPCNNAFITKLSPSGAVAWTTYLGGFGPDDAHAIAVDSAGNIWVAGATVSPNFPTTPSAISRTFHGEADLGPLRYGDAFVTKLDSNGSDLLYSTYLGGGAPDAAFAIAVDPTGAAYIAGSTQSTDFPTTPGALSTTYSGSTTNLQSSLTGNGFITKLDASGNLTYSTFTGIANSQAVAIAVDDSGEAHVSLGAGIPPPTVAPSSLIQHTCPASPNPAVIVLNPVGSALTATSPIPGTYLAVDSKGGVYTAGNAYTLVFFSTPHAFQTEYGGGDSDAFVSKVDLTQTAAPSLASVLNAASLLPGYGSSFAWGAGAIAPGEIVSLFGNGFGASPTVTFGIGPAPVIYASDCQINAVVPFGVTPGGPVPVTVQFGDETLGPVELPVVSAQPGIFGILNQDDTVNSPSNPAARGSVISVFMTGTGSLTPSLTDGSPGPLIAPFPTPLASIHITVGSVDAPISFAGQAPGLVAGVTQVNVQVPQNAPIGAAVPITIYAAGYPSQPGLTTAVQ